MKVIVTTSNRYLHILPMFCFLFNKYWAGPVEIVGYDDPRDDYIPIPSNFSFHSMGEQIGGPENFSTDLGKYFAKQDDWFIWMMEDTLIRQHVDTERLKLLKALTFPGVGRINLTGEGHKQNHNLFRYLLGEPIIENTQDANYRLSTMPSIWNREFLLKYMTPGLTPWAFEKQHSINDGFMILGPVDPVVNHTEGIRKDDPRCIYLGGIDNNDLRDFNSKVTFR